MEDMERYGDYNDIEEAPEKPGVVGIIFKSLVALVIVAVIAILGFRMFLFNVYPDSMQTLYLVGSLTKYSGNPGDVHAMTQANSIKYDDAKDGNFFFEHMMVVPEDNHLQVSVRYNTSLIDSLNAKYGLDLSYDDDPSSIFTFSLTKTEDGYVPPEEITENTPIPTEKAGDFVTSISDSSFMYRFVRVAFDNVELGLDEGETPVGWVRLEIGVKALQDNPDFMNYRLMVYYGDYGLVDCEPKNIVWEE